MKKFYYLLAVCALITMPFTSCSDDDDEENQLVPGKAVSNLSFTDTDTEVGKIGGTLKWDLPEPETNIDDYVIYFGDVEKEKKIKVGEVPKGTTSYLIPVGTDLHPYVSVVARNAAGESSNIFSIPVNDNTEEVVTDIKFEDKDNTKDKISGTVSWTAPENSTREVTGYVIYLSDNDNEKGEKIGEVAAGVTTFEIPEGTAFKAKMNVVVKTVDGENDDFTSINVVDVFTKWGFYILNSGNQNANNASLSYYDYNTGELITEVYKKENGKGLGDSAEQLLIYGSKMYITVTGSNRIAVLDKEGKEIESITPQGDEPMNPRCMVADNGKVYITYYYGHSVAVLDTASLSVEKIIPVGRYPEQLAVTDGKIYVANSGGLDYDNEIGRGKTVSVIDQQSLTVTKNIEVVINPTQLAVDSQGDIYVISMGDYGDVKNTLQRIGGQTNNVTEMGNASYMKLVNDELYTIYAQWGDAAITYKKYNAKTDELISDNFIPDGGNISPNNSPVVTVNPDNGQIIVIEAPYGATSSLHLFNSEGKSEGKSIDTGGYYAKWITFIRE